MRAIPAIAQLVEHQSVDICSNQMVPDLIPGGRMCVLIELGGTCVSKPTAKHTRGQARVGNLQEVRHVPWRSLIVDRLPIKADTLNMASPLTANA